MKLIKCTLVAMFYFPISFVCETVILQKGFDYTWSSTKELLRDC